MTKQVNRRLRRNEKMMERKELTREQIREEILQKYSENKWII